MVIPISTEFPPDIESVYSRTLEHAQEDGACLQFRIGQTFDFGKYTVQVKEDAITISSNDPDQPKFAALVEAWHKERKATSSPIKVAMCPSYQKIIGMGKPAIPLIFRQLELEGAKPDMWFWALRALTDANPVADDIRGNFVKMAEAWLEWGRSRYSW